MIVQNNRLSAVMGCPVAAVFRWSRHRSISSSKLCNRLVLPGIFPVVSRLNVVPSGLEFVEFTRLFQHFFKILN